ncbi:MAG: hypothetical protein M3Z93_04820, partial [Commensalibacter sp.]|nr:hypothetical protein [Commensalibacter sp.]
LFWIMTIYGFLGTVSVIIMLPDTLPIKYRIQSSIRSILWRYIRIVQEPVFSSNTLITSFGLFMIFAYLSGTPDILSNVMHFSKLQLALWFGINSAVIAGCNQLNGILINKFKPSFLTNCAVNVAFIVSILFIILCFLPLPHNCLGIILVCSPIVIIMGCLGFIFPNCTIFAFTLHGRKIGSASALLGTIQFILGALSSWIMGLLPQDNMLYVAIGVFIGVFGFFLCNLWRQYATCKIISKMQERVSKGNNNFDRLIKDLK